MIKKIWWLSLGLLAGYGCLSTTTYAAKNEIEVQYIDSKDFSVKEKDNVPENTSVFYINKEFNKNKKNQIRKIDDIEYLENGEKNIVVNEDVEIAATYNFTKIMLDIMEIYMLVQKIHMIQLKIRLKKLCCKLMKVHILMGIIYQVNLDL